MNGIASKIAEKVLVFFQHHNVHAATGQEEAQHDAGRSAADNATGAPVRNKSRTIRAHAGTEAKVFAAGCR